MENRGAAPPDATPPPPSSTGQGRRWWFVVVVVPLVVALVGGGGFVSWWKLFHDHRDPEGKITYPKSGARIPGPALTVTGTLKNIPDDKHVWLAVQVGNLLWPKASEIDANECRWQRVIQQQPSQTSLALVLIMVDESGDRQIKDWLEGSVWPGQSPIPGSAMLDVLGDVVVE